MKRLHLLRVSLLLVVILLTSRMYRLQLVDSEAQRYDRQVNQLFTRTLALPPLRGEILASDGKTVLAESMPTFALAVRPGDLPLEGNPMRQQVFARLSQLAGLTSTLTITPVMALDRQPTLRNDLQHLFGDKAVEATDTLPATTAYTFTLATPARTMEAFHLTQTYSNVLVLNDPISPLLAHSNIPSYQTVTIQNDISHDLALVLRENSASLPGIVVEEDYRRRYPQSGNVPSISHVLGYIGRISECELVSENPGTSWVNSMLDVVEHAPGCRRFVPKQIDPSVLGEGLPPYQADDRIGKDGLEASYERELRGSSGIQSLVVDAVERPVGPAITQRPVQDGNNLVLTIDLQFQHQTEDILRRWLAISDQRRIKLGGYKSQYKPITNGVAVAIDPQSGRVLAMVSLPDYDNNVWVDRSRAAELQTLLGGSPDPQVREDIERTAPLLNRTIAGSYPPGSTLKQFVGSIALQDGVIRPDTQIRDPGKLLVQDQYTGQITPFPNSTPNDNKLITVSDALKVSSNVFFATVAGGNNVGITNLTDADPHFDGLTIDRFAPGLGWFGFGKATGIALAGETSGRVPTKRWKLQEQRAPWTIGDTYNMAIGQGNLEVTPMQLVSAGAAIANGGTLYRPQLVHSILDSSGAVKQNFIPESTQVPVDPSYLAVIREGMRRSVTEGANKAARDDCSGMTIAGKTGTAEFGPPITKPDGKITRQSHSWFVGFAPYDNPQIEVAVLLEGTGDLNDGSATLAVPTATQIMQAYLKVTPPAEPGVGCPKLDQ